MTEAHKFDRTKKTCKGVNTNNQATRKNRTNRDQCPKTQKQKQRKVNKKKDKAQNSPQEKKKMCGRKEARRKKRINRNKSTNMQRKQTVRKQQSQGEDEKNFYQWSLKRISSMIMTHRDFNLPTQTISPINTEPLLLYKSPLLIQV